MVVDVDFGEVTSNSTIICCLNGHTHNCGCYWLNRCEYEGVKHKVLNINQETGCYMPDSIHQATSGTDKFYRFNVSDVIRGGNLAQDCFNIIKVMAFAISSEDKVFHTNAQVITTNTLSGDDNLNH